MGLVYYVDILSVVQFFCGASTIAPNDEAYLSAKDRATQHLLIKDFEGAAIMPNQSKVQVDDLYEIDCCRRCYRPDRRVLGIGADVEWNDEGRSHGNGPYEDVKGRHDADEALSKNDAQSDDEKSALCSYDEIASRHDEKRHDEPLGQAGGVP